MSPLATAAFGSGTSGAAPFATADGASTTASSTRAARQAPDRVDCIVVELQWGAELRVIWHLSLGRLYTIPAEIAGDRPAAAELPDFGLPYGRCGRPAHSGTGQGTGAVSWQ